MGAGRQRRFVLVDPCLTGLGSHPYHYAAVILAAAARAGCDRLLVTHRDFTAPLPDVPVLPAFTHTAYSKYTLGGGLDSRPGWRPSWLPQPPWQVGHADRRRAERTAAFAREVRPAFDGLAAGDVVLVATASELEAAGLARAIAAAEPPPGVGWHVQYHLPIMTGFAADLPAHAARIAAARGPLAAALAAATPHAIHHHATTEELAWQYERLVGGPVGVLPYPAQVPATRRHDGAPLRVACLGDARPEKGSASLAAIVAATAADPELAGRVRFVVQTNRGYPAASRRREHLAVTRSLAALARIAAAGGPVELVAGPLDAAAYAHQLATADIALLPYDQDRYRCRCSGVVLEALAGGLMPIVTGGGWMARQFATPIEAHAAAVRAAAEVGEPRRLVRPLVGRRPLLVEPPAGPETAGAWTAAVVEVAWDGAADEWLSLPPVRVAVAGGTRPPTVLAAGTAGVATAVFPLPPRARPLVELTAACPGRPAMPAAVTIRTVRTGGPVPASAVGLVIAAAADSAAAIREVVRHADHYRATAAAHAATVRRAATADEVVRRLLS
jgi:hypothetical protein